MKRLRVIHLIDDTTAGGVMRVLDHIQTSPELAAFADHVLQPVSRKAWNYGRSNADVIVSHLSINWRALPALISLRATNPGTPLVHVEHSYTERFVTLNVTAKRRFVTLLRTAYALFDRVVAVSHEQGKWLLRRSLIDAKSLVVIGSSVALDRFLDLGDPKYPTRVIGAVGRLDRQKGFDTLILAFRQCHAPGIQLRIFGEGAEKDELQALADGDGRIRFEGFNADPAAIMEKIDVLAMPSRWEAYGLSALEARAAGRSVLAANIDGLRDQITQGAVAVNGQGVSDWAKAIEAATTAASHIPAHTSQELRQHAQDHDARFIAAWRKLLIELAHPQATTQIKTGSGAPEAA